MTETVVFALAGCGVGLGLWLLTRAVFSRRVIPLDEIGSILGGVAPALDPSTPGRSVVVGEGRVVSVAQRLVMRHSATRNESLAQRLRLVGKSEADYALEKVLLAVVGFCFAPAVGLALGALGFRIGPAWLLAATPILALGGFFYPDLPLAEQAEHRRREFRFSLGSYLDFVTIMLAGGAGTQSALQAAAEAGDGWPFAELRGAIGRADSTGTSVWDAFERLADELGVDELNELAASVALAGGQGGRVKDSLVAKADAMRVAHGAELEAMSESQTEKMIIPVVVMIAGLVLFIGFGAISIVSGDAPIDAGFEAEAQP